MIQEMIFSRYMNLPIGEISINKFFALCIDILIKFQTD